MTGSEGDLRGERLARRGRHSLAGLAPQLAQAQLAAGALDAVENAALLSMLADARGDGLPRLAFGCAAAKFALLAAGWLHLLAAVCAPGTASSKLDRVATLDVSSSA